ncbi:SDR family NAD(P)-dependent oxidoreductase [Acrocarpospora pleiomorpha]|nr:SDR family NAD(P)-dependent oxidoreductase [Acrocarpospora pleiomorpha]
MSGRTAVVTGAARGMGRTHCLALAARGVAIAMVDLDEAELGQAVQEVVKAGGTARPYAVDITSGAAAADLVTRVAADFGGIDVLVHNAGLLFSLTGLADTDDQDFRRLLDVNVHAPLALTRAALPYLRSSSHARVIFISSQWGQVPAGHSYGYMVSKAAQLGLMKTMATEFAPEGILVNAIAPGAIRTRMVPDDRYEEECRLIPIGRIGEPQEISAVVAFLASDEASFVTGQTIPVNGGALVVGI